MDSRGTTDRYADALSARIDRRNASARVLGPGAPALLFADAGLRNRPLGSEKAPSASTAEQTLETYLQPLIGEESREVAAQLISRFGTVARALEASSEALTSALGDKTQATAKICAARQLMRFAVNEQLVGSAVDPVDPRLHQYLRTKLLNPNEERMQAVYVDHKGLYLTGETIARGTTNALLIRIRHVIHRALDLGASGLLIAHNHPSGSCLPSDADRRSTTRLRSIAAAMELHVIDHMIVSTNGIYSMERGQKL